MPSSSCVVPGESPISAAGSAGDGCRSGVGSAGSNERSVDCDELLAVRGVEDTGSEELVEPASDMGIIGLSKIAWLNLRGRKRLPGEGGCRNPGLGSWVSA